MTDNELIVALNSKSGEYPIYDYMDKAIDLINRQKAEIERLRKQLYLAEGCINRVDDALYRGSDNDWANEAIEEYNRLVKEMTEKI